MHYCKYLLILGKEGVELIHCIKDNIKDAGISLTALLQQVNVFGFTPLLILVQHWTKICTKLYNSNYNNLRQALIKEKELKVAEEEKNQQQ